MTDTFSYVPDRSFTRQSKPRVNIAKFGDGYSQRYAAGINTVEEAWTLNFKNKTISVANAIMDFFYNKQGAEYFLWTPQGETTQVKVICQEWNLEYTSEISRSINCTFNRVYDI
jgi:phage-related protein